MDLKAWVRALNPQADSKAILAHPALLDHDTPLVYRADGNARHKAALSQREASAHLAAYGGHEAIDWVMDCVRLVVETAASAEWHFEEEGTRMLNQRNSLLPDEPVADPLLVNLFREPNPYMDWAELVELTLIDYLLVGNSYWLKYRTYDEAGNRPLALYRLAPPYVKIKPGPFGIEGYEYDVPGQKEPLNLRPESVLHFRQANPHNPYLGLGIIKGAARMLDMEIALTDTQASYFEKKATPSMVFHSDRRVPTDVKTKMRQMLRSFYGGSHNAGEIMVLEAGLKALPVTPSAQDAAFAELTRLSRDRILAAFRVPPPLLGVADHSVEKINEAQRVFDTKTMRPLLDKFQHAVTRGLTKPGWDVDFVVDYEYIMPPEEQLKLVGSFAAIPGVTVREIREYAGLPPLGDERDDLVLNLPGEDATEDDHDAGFADRNLGDEAGRPPNGENTRTFPEPGGRLPKDSEARRSRKAMTPDQVLKRLREIEAMEGKAPTSGEVKLEQTARTDLDRRIERPQDRLRPDREAEVDIMVADAKSELADAAHLLERALLDHVEGKAPTIYQRIKNSQAWRDFTERITGILERLSARAIQRAVILEGREGRRSDDEIDYEAIAREVVHGGHAPRDITETLRKSLGAKVLEAQRSQQGRSEFEGIVREAISNWQDSGAEAVALDTSTESYNEGTLTVAELLGHTHVVVFDGTDHDEPCRAANGQVWSIEKARENRKQHSRCRRAFTAVEA